MQKWKKISSKVILDHSRLKVLEDTVELPNGKVTDYLKFENKGNAATIICLNKESKFLLQTEYSYPPNEILFQFPGGFVPLGEEIEIGANRELMEEAKYRARTLTLLGSYLSNNRRTEAICYVFLATDLIEEGKQEDEEENIESYWFTEDEINEKVKNNEIRNGSVLAAWALYKVKK